MKVSLQFSISFFSFLVILFFRLSTITAQIPQAIPYQAIARNNNGEVIANQSITLQFTIHDGSSGGTIVYEEIQIITTNLLGLFTVNIGQGAAITGTFASINWSTNAKFLQVEMDPTGAFDFIDMGTTQMLSVPYALFAGTSSNGIPNGVSNGNTLRWNGTAWVVDSTLTNKQTNVGIGITSPDSSALLDLSSSSKGFTMPRMTTAQRDAISLPIVGLQIFNTDDQCVNIYDGANWIETCGLKVIGTGIIPGNLWVQKTNFGGIARREATGFSIAGKGYIGTGVVASGPANDFWEYDPLTTAWTQKANFGGSPVYGATAFSIGSKGYVGGGYDFANYRSDFWEYDPLANEWTQKANFGGGVRYGAAGFSIGGKGYFGTGSDGSYRNDFWEYDPITNIWTQKTNFGGSGRNGAAGFSIGTKGYIGTGFNFSGNLNDFWEYDPMSNTWTQKANFGGGIRTLAACFSIGSKGYMGIGLNSSGSTNDFWEYDPTLNAWTQKLNFGGTARWGAVAFSIGDNGYIGTGFDGDLKNDFWEYVGNATGNIYSSIMPSGLTASIDDGSWTRSNNDVYNSNSGNIGIGTTSPTSLLHTIASGSKSSNYSGNLFTNVASSSTSSIIKSGVEIQSTGSWNGSSAKNIGLYVSSVTGGTNNYDAIFNGGGNVGIGTASPSAMLHTVASGTKTIAYSGNLFTNTATSSTSSINKAGVEIQSTGSWNGASAKNIGLYVSSVTGGTNNYDAVFNGGGNVGIGTASPSAILHTVASGAKTLPYIGNILTNTATSSTSSINKVAVEIQSTGSWNGASAKNIGLYISSVTGGTNNYDAVFNGGGNVGIGTVTPSAMLHTVASGAKTVAYSGNLFTNTATSSTGSINKAGVEIQSTGTWNGASANNIGLYVSSVTGGTNNYDAVFNGGGNVGIGTASPSAMLHTVASGVKTLAYSGNLFTNTATSSTSSINKAGVEIQSTGSWNGSSANNIGLYVSSVTGGTNNYDAVFNGGGNVGIGTASPSAMLHTVASGAKSVAYSGNLFTNTATSSTSSINKAGVEIRSTGSWNGTGASNIGLYVSSVTGGTNNYDAVFNGGGNVGIGTASPSAMLHTIASGAKTTAYSGNLFANNATSSTSSINKAGVEIQSTGSWNGASAKNIGLYVSSVTGGTNNYDAIFNGGGNVGIGTATPSAMLHTVASGAKTAAYSGNLFTNTATSSTVSITKAGVEIQSTGSWNGASANNIGLYVSSVTGGTNNYDAIFNGGGNVGIGTVSPASKLDVEGGISIGTSYSGSSAAPTNGAIIEGNVGIGTSGPVSKLDVEGGVSIGSTYSGSSAAPTNGAIIEGNVGIGTSSPHVQLQLGNTPSNRKIVLSEIANDDHQFYGFGWNSNSLRYQVAGTNNDHVFYASTSSSSSSELMRIKGTGVVKVTGLAGTNNRSVYADASGNLVASNNVVKNSNFTTTSRTAGSTATVISASPTLDVSIGDVIVIEAQVSLRLTGGNGIDDFTITVAQSGIGFVTFSTGTSAANNLVFRPSEDQNDHDNFHPVSYLEYATVTNSGTISFSLSVGNSGDDPWEHNGAIMVVRKL